MAVSVALMQERDRVGSHALHHMGISAYCSAWLCDAASLMEEIEEVFRREDPGTLNRMRVYAAAALRRLLDRIPNEVLDASICHSRCGHHVSTLMRVLHDVERSPAGYWVGDQRTDIHFLDCLRVEMAKKPYLKAADNLKRVHAATTLSLFNYLAGLKAAYSKIMIIRLDLHFPWHPEALLATTGREETQWKALLLYVKNSFQSFLGYAAKFEVGAERGVHMHTVWVFNGSQVRSDVIIARMIGDHWHNEIQQGRAGYFNCNARKHLKRMKWPAVGSFTEANESFLVGMRHLSNYLAKPDTLVRVALPQISRRLRRSRLTDRQRRRIVQRKALAERRTMRLATVNEVVPTPALSSQSTSSRNP